MRDFLGIPASLFLLASLLAGCPDERVDDDVLVDDDAADDDLTGDDDVSPDDDDSSAGDDDSAPGGDFDQDGWTIFDGDCDDWNDAVYPGAPETPCDEIDSNCDGAGEGMAAAAVGDVEFATLTAAVEGAADGDTVSICPGTYYEQVYVPDDRAITITSASGSPEDTILDGQDLRSVMHLDHGSSVTVSHLTLRNGQAEPLCSGQHCGGGIASFSESLTIEDCRFVDDHADADGGIGGGVYFGEGSGLTVSDSSFEGCRAEHSGGGMHRQNYEPLTLEVTRTTFSSCTAAEYEGGGFRVCGWPVEAGVTDCIFEYGEVGYGGGAFSLSNWTNLSISGCSFHSNTAGHVGGAVALLFDHDIDWTDSTLTLSDSSFTDNVSGYGGGGLASSLTEETLTAHMCAEDVQFTGNAAGHSGGALSLDGDGAFDILMTDVDFHENLANKYGAGAVKLRSDYGGTTWTMEGGSFVGNSCPNMAAAVHLAADEWDPLSYIHTTLDGVLIDGNETTDHGAILNGDSCELTLTDCTVTGNSGGGVKVWTDPSSILTSANTDWGTAGDDNTPWDVTIREGPEYDTFGASETFVCTGGGECI